MAAFHFGAGARTQALAHMALDMNEGAAPVMEAGPTGEACVARVEGPCLTVTRAMVVAALFDGRPEYEASVDMRMQHLALTASGKVLISDRDRVVVADDDRDRPMSLRMKAHHQAAISHLSGRLGLSRNDFVLRAIDHYVKYLGEIEAMKEEPI